MGPALPQTKESKKALKKELKAQAALEKAQQPTRSQKAAAKQQVAKLEPKAKQFADAANKLWKNGEHGDPWAQYRNASSQLTNTIAELKKTGKPLATKDFDNLMATDPSVAPQSSAASQSSVAKARKSSANKANQGGNDANAQHSSGQNSSRDNRQRSNSLSSSSRNSRQRSASRSGE